jgi:hypothetical protein
VDQGGHHINHLLKFGQIEHQIASIYIYIYYIVSLTVLIQGKTEQEKQIEPPETPNSYCCEDREKMATAGSTIPRALAQRGCLGQHKS